VVTALTAAVLSPAAKQFSDPAPPKVTSTDDRAAAKPQPNPLGTFHQAPKPLSQKAETTDWAGFLGPEHNPISAETNVLQSFGKGGPPLVWEMAKGTGYSSPAIQGDYLVYLHRQSSQEVVEALHPETGKRYWRYLYDTDFEDRYGYNNGPRASPVIAGERVYTWRPGRAALPEFGNRPGSVASRCCQGIQGPAGFLWHRKYATGGGR